MNIGESLVASALQSLGYFVIQGLKAGVREADFLTIKKAGKQMIFWHIEVHISRNPVGVLRPFSRFGDSAKNPSKAAEEFIEKKFFQKDLCRKIEDVFGTKDYERMFIHGRLKTPDQLKVFAKKNIRCLALDKLIEEAANSDTQTDAFQNFYGVASQMKF